MNYWDVDRMPVFMAATPEFVEKNGDAVVRYLKAWMAVADDFRNNKQKVSDSIYAFYTSKGYKMSPDTFRNAVSTIEVNPGFPSNVRGYMQAQAEVLLREKKIKEIPDWGKALRPEFMQRARS
jgi:ABC-type nitrate/sulfonate/bicarbonate transport system substrate-binding protein